MRVPHDRARPTLWWPCLGLALCLFFNLGGIAQAQLREPADPHSAAQLQAPTAFGQARPVPILDWGSEQGTSYWVPVADIFLFDFLLNMYNRQFSGEPDYDADFESLKDNIRGSWVYDTDQFDINQFGHPYQGNMYHGFARSAGLNYWEASVYTILGSAFWEVAGEITAPSVNDQVTTGFAGGFLGEPLYRMASLLLESSPGMPGIWRELAAAFISPASGFNRWAYGDRFDGVFRSHNPAVYTSISLGGTFKSAVSSSVNRNPDLDGTPIPQSYRTGVLISDFTMAYGLPGKPGYSYDRPFDYFHMQFTATSENILENVMTRGLLLGTDYAWGDNYRGIWGLYGTYDYIAPQIFRVSSTAAAFGTTAQWWLAPRIALQGTLLAGIGYGSAGTIDSVGKRDYHIGVTPQGMLALRFIYKNRIALDTTLRNYYVTDIGSSESGNENIFRSDISLTWRVHKLHALALKFIGSQRDASYDNQPGTVQRVGAVSIGYTYLGQTRSGAIDWRHH